MSDLEKMIAKMKKTYKNKQSQLKKRDMRKLNIKEKKRKPLPEKENKYDIL